MEKFNFESEGVECGGDVDKGASDPGGVGLEKDGESADGAFDVLDGGREVDGVDGVGAALIPEYSILGFGHRIGSQCASQRPTSVTPRVAGGVSHR